LSSEAGVGAKATTTSRIVGIALENQDNEGVVKITIRNEIQFASSVTSNLRSLFTPINDSESDTIWNCLVTLASNFVDGVLSVAGVKTNELCVGEVCVDESTFLKMVENARDSGEDVVPVPDPEPTPTLEPEPEPTLETVI
jgi:hypothetical protein